MKDVLQYLTLQESSNGQIKNPVGKTFKEMTSPKTETFPNTFIERIYDEKHLGEFLFCEIVIH